MGNIKRYEPALVLDEHNDKVPAEMDWASDGEYVRHDDHIESRAAARREGLEEADAIVGAFYQAEVDALAGLKNTVNRQEAYAHAEAADIIQGRIRALIAPEASEPSTKAAKAGKDKP